MFTKALLAALPLAARAQQPGSQDPSEQHPSLTIQTCTGNQDCTSSDQSIVLDSNWRWTDVDATNCYLGNERKAASRPPRRSSRPGRAAPRRASRAPRASRASCASQMRRAHALERRAPKKHHAGHLAAQIASELRRVRRDQARLRKVRAQQQSNAFGTISYDAAPPPPKSARKPRRKEATSPCRGGGVGAVRRRPKSAPAKGRRRAPHGQQWV